MGASVQLGTVRDVTSRPSDRSQSNDYGMRSYKQMNKALAYQPYRYSFFSVSLDFAERNKKKKHRRIKTKEYLIRFRKQIKNRLVSDSFYS